MTRHLSSAPAGLAGRAYGLVITWLLLALLVLAPIAPAFAVEPAPGAAAPQAGSERRGEGPAIPTT